MSHISKIRTRLKNEAALRKALADLGLEVSTGTVRGTFGQKAKFKIPSGTPGYDIGFAETDGCFELVADWDVIEGITPRILETQLLQRTAYHFAMAQFKDQGMHIMKEEVLPNGEIRILAGRDLMAEGEFQRQRVKVCVPKEGRTILDVTGGSNEQACIGLTQALAIGLGEVEELTHTPQGPETPGARVRIQQGKKNRT